MCSLLELLPGDHDQLAKSTTVVSRMPDKLVLTLKNIYLHCLDEVIPTSFRLQAL